MQMGTQSMRALCLLSPLSLQSARSRSGSDWRLTRQCAPAPLARRHLPTCRSLELHIEVETAT